MIRIIRMKDSHVSAVAELHTSCLNRNLNSPQGRRMMKLFYKTVLGMRETISLVAVDRHQVTGFVCGIADKRATRRQLLQHHPIQLPLLTAFLSFRRNDGIANTVSRWLGRRVESGPQHVFPNDAVELRPIVVSPEFRGRGIAGELMDAFVSEAHQLHFGSTYLRTSATNLAAITAYRKFGFDEVTVPGDGVDPDEVFFSLSLKTDSERTTLPFPVAMPSSETLPLAS